MEPGPALLLSVVIILLVLVAAAYVWYNFVGWTSFSYSTGDSPSWLPAGGADLSALRFKNCEFTVKRSDGVTKKLEVSPVLNSMSAGFKGGLKNPLTLTLTRPLNPFSFVIVGFNDRATVSDPGAPPWCSTPPAACGSDASSP